MKNSHTIHRLFIAWGKACRQLPPDNIHIKQGLLDKLTPALADVVRHKSLPWLSFAFASLAIFILIGNALIMPQGQYVLNPPVYYDDSVPRMAPSLEGGRVNPIPISDTREFLKMNYSARLRTRHVDELTQRIQTLVRGFGGRIDSASSSSRDGYISFVIPVSNFHAFKAEIESLVYAKFFSGQMSAQNLLPQKQSIEVRQEEAQKSLDELNGERNQLTITHQQAVASLRSQLNNIDRRLANLRAEVPSDPERKAQIAAQIEALLRAQQDLKTRLQRENSIYADKMSSLDSRIKEVQSTLESIKQEDKNFLDDVATVQGTISLQWISILEIISLYFFDSLVFWGLVAAAVVAFAVHWYRYTVLLSL